MATIGQALTAAEAGWKRVENTDPMFSYSGFTVYSESGASGGSSHYTSNGSTVGEINFKFKGTKLRIISSTTSSNRASGISISIDGKEYTFSARTSSTQSQTLVFETNGLTDGFHSVKIYGITGVTSGWAGFGFDAIDIDESGYLAIGVGAVLANPESGWRRYDDLNQTLAFEGSWTSFTAASASGGSYRRTSTVGNKVSFKFKGTKIRLISPRNTDLSTKMSISIDGASEDYSLYSSSLTWNVLVYEKSGLSDGYHEVVITANTTSINIVDAIDIDDTGYLILPDTQPITGGQLRDRVSQTVIGDYVRCHYSAPSNAAGQFMGLGEDLELGEIPLTGTATPNGHFYFIKVADNLLIADRNIQNSVTWNVLNSAMLARGSRFNDSLIPPLTSNVGINGVATCSSMFSATYDAWRAFDRLNTSVSVWATVSGTKVGWIAYEFNRPVLVQRYTIRSRTAEPTSAPRRWTLEAFDGESWIILHSAEYAGWIGDDEQTYSFYNTFMYRKYRLNVLQNNGHASYVAIADLRLCADYEEYVVRMPKGGRSYLGTDGYSANVDAGLGAFPVKNEWDEYLTRSRFSNAGNNNGEDVWHYSQNAGGTWCGENDIAAATSMTLRGKGGILSKREGLAFSSATGNFRPVIEIPRN